MDLFGEAPELLAVVEVGKAQRVGCQAPGCGHGVFRRVCLVRSDDKLGVYGSDCCSRIFGRGMGLGPPKYNSSGGDGRRLTEAERELLATNADLLIEQFEGERVAEEERRSRLLADQRARYEQDVRSREEEERAKEARKQLIKEAMAGVEGEAKAAVRRRWDVDANNPAWRGLVMGEQRRLLLERGIQLR